MSWKDKIVTPYSITTGDGKEYVFAWLNASKARDFNIAEFDFIEVEGTYVDRRTRRGLRLNIELYFQGDDHLEQAAAFDESAKDPAPWTLQHPLYGRLTVQPIGLVFDNSEYNITRITGGVIETISTNPNKVTTSAPDKIVADKVETDAACLDAYAENVPDPKAADLQSIISNASAAYNEFLTKISTNEDAANFLNAYNAVNTAIGAGLTNTVNAVGAMQDLISIPYKIQNDVVDRIGMLTNLLAYMVGTVHADSRRAAKFLFENNGASTITSILATAITNVKNTYRTRNGTLSVVASVLDAYNLFLSTLDALQTLTGGLPSSFIPSRAPLAKLSTLVGFTVQTLLIYAADGKQERTIYLAETTNPVMLARELYGKLPADDSTIEDLIEANALTVDELIELRKGRKITYYV